MTVLRWAAIAERSGANPNNRKRNWQAGGEGAQNREKQENDPSRHRPFGQTKIHQKTAAWRPQSLQQVRAQLGVLSRPGADVQTAA
jgi:hypothetical protein